MKIQPLYDLQQEINRLFIAGSKFAKNDPRLLKHVPVFNKLGEKAPVFKKIATDIEALTQIDSLGSSEKLMALSTLLYSVLYTQGETVEPEQLEEACTPLLDLRAVSTDFTYMDLKPIIIALNESKEGRFAIIEDAFHRGVFSDFRTCRHLDRALSDKYSELADYVEKTIIPSIGKTMLPFLFAHFSYEGRMEDVRRLRLLNKLGYPDVFQMVKKVLDGKSVNLQVEAVNILAQDLQYEALIIQLADDKNKPVREAAYMALAQLNTEEALMKLRDLYLKNQNKSNTEGIVRAIGASRSTLFFQEILDRVNKSFDQILDMDENTEEKVLLQAFENFEMQMEALRYKDKSAVYDFFSYILDNKKYNSLIHFKKTLLNSSAIRISVRMASCLESLADEKVLEFYEKNLKLVESKSVFSLLKKEKIDEWKIPLYKRYLDICVHHPLLQKKIYDMFASVYDSNIIDANDIISAYRKGDGDLDPRWAKKMSKELSNLKSFHYSALNTLLFLNEYEPKDSKQLNQLLMYLVTIVPVQTCTKVYEIMIEREVSGRFKSIFSSIENILGRTPSNQYYFYQDLLNANFWSEFPKEYSAKFKTLFKTTKNAFFEAIASKIGNE